MGSWRGWDKWAKGGGQIGSVYKQPEKREDDSCHSWRVQVSGKGYKGGKKGIARGAKGNWEKTKGTTPCIYVNCDLCMKNN
jgi:hypothetical protein